MNAHASVMAIGRLLNWPQQLVVPNTYFAGGEMDMAVVTKSGYLWEIEIKLTTGDWNADRLKRKWGNDRSAVSRFYYAVPTRLLTRIPEWVPSQAGIIELFDGHARIHRQARRQPASKLTDKQINKLLSSLYFRFWRLWHERQSK